MSESCIIRQGILHRWIIFHPWNVMSAWSGSRWVLCGSDAIPVHGGVQVCNFDTEQEARDYCREIGLEPQN